MDMKTLIMFLCFLALLFTFACSAPSRPNTNGDSDSPGQDETQKDSGNSENNVSYEKSKQRWSFNEFHHNEEDVLFFTPVTDDYMLTEFYGNVHEGIDIYHTLTILRSFDETGKVIHQVAKYTFDIPSSAEYYYAIFLNDESEYPSLVCVGYSMMVEQPADVIAGQRTKEQFVNDYTQDGVTKFWLSQS